MANSRRTASTTGVPRTLYASVDDLLRHKNTETPVFCYFPHRVRRAVEEFVRLFPGEVLYAVKANPDPELVRWVVEGGVRGFDVASVAEIELVRGILPQGRLAYNHPVKSRDSIRRAYRDFGVREFVVDHAAELEKLFEETGTDIIVQVRVATSNAAAAVSFNGKFGASAADAAVLMRRASERGVRVALTMHVGWQTTDPQAYANGIRTFAEVSEAAGVPPAYLNVGGGFPSILMPRNRTLKDFMDAILAASVRQFGNSPPALTCEPGSALVTSGAAVLAQVLLVKDAAVYLNDGIHGALAELIHSKIQPPTFVLGRDGQKRTGPTQRYRLFGPTCDSADESPAPFELPIATREGDWLLLEGMGAYSAALITNFNGLGEHEFAIIAA